MPEELHPDIWVTSRTLEWLNRQGNPELFYLHIDDQGHGISKPKNQKVLYQRLAVFFEEAFAQ